MEISTDYIPTIAKVKSEGELEAEFKLQQLTFTIAGRKGKSYCLFTAVAVDLLYVSLFGRLVLQWYYPFSRNISGIQSTAQFTLNTSCGEMPFLTDPECYRLLLQVTPSIILMTSSLKFFFQFYDGICQWEEGSKFPVLHIGWANNILYALGKFQPDTR